MLSCLYCKRSALQHEQSQHGNVSAGLFLLPPHCFHPCLQIYPSFFQAPSASEALLPDGLVFSSGALPVVTIVFCAPDQAGLRWGTAAIRASHACWSARACNVACCVEDGRRASNIHADGRTVTAWNMQWAGVHGECPIKFPSEYHHVSMHAVLWPIVTCCAVTCRPAGQWRRAASVPASKRWRCSAQQCARR
jgi:hypothetical protein